MLLVLVFIPFLFLLLRNWLRERQCCSLARKLMLLSGKGWLAYVCVDGRIERVGAAARRNRRNSKLCAACNGCLQLL